MVWFGLVLESLLKHVNWLEASAQLSTIDDWFLLSASVGPLYSPPTTIQSSKYIEKRCFAERFLISDNWALIFAQKLALHSQVPLLVAFCLVPKFGDASLRMYKFMLDGLREVQKECTALGIGFYLLIGLAKDVLPQFLRERKCATLVCDFSPLRVPLQWVQDVKGKIGNIPFHQVDAHNIVPCWVASDKEEIGARTLRGKIQKYKSQYLTEFPPVITHPYCHTAVPPTIDWDAAERSLEVNRLVDAVQWAKPGTTRGLLVLREFLTLRLKKYAQRNDPNAQALSMLSPWFHFGQVSVARSILEGEKVVRAKVALF